MSMISAQIDELRELAGDGSMEWVVGPIRASVLRDAADTIWQLRDDLQRTNDAVLDAEHDESMAWDRVRKAEAEADKLREQGARLFDKTLELGTENEKLQASNEVIAEDHAALCEHNAKLRELVQDFDKCLTEAVRLAYIQGHMTIYDGTLLDSLHPRMRELKMEDE